MNIMNTQLARGPYRSEAFAEDLVGLVAETPGESVLARRFAWLLGWLPLGVALLGVAFAVVPPLV
jgi:hypothetical protein